MFTYLFIVTVGESGFQLSNYHESLRTLFTILNTRTAFRRQTGVVLSWKQHVHLCTGGQRQKNLF